MLKPIRNKSTLITLFLIFSTIILFNTGLWYFFALVWQSKENDLNIRLNSISQILPYALNADDLVLLSSGDEDSLIYKKGLEVLKKHKTFNSFRSAMILNYENEKLHVVIDADEKYKIGDDMPLLLMDTQEIEKSLKGEVITTPLYFVENIPYKRTYAPVYDSEGSTVIGLIRLEANIEYYKEMTALKHKLIALSVITSFILIIVASIFHKIMLKLVNVQEAVARADRLQSMGRLGAGIAHEIRNPLGIIRVSAECIIGDIEQTDKRSANLLKDIIEEVDRINSLITRFLSFSKPEQIISDSINPVQTAETIVSLMMNSLKKEEKTIVLEFEADIPEIKISEDNYKQILLNLILNAKDALSAGGEIKVELLKKGRFVRTIVSDNGCGIDENDLSKVYDPFFTKKEGGTGLGLFIVNNIIKNEKGNIEIESVKDKGTTIKFDLPAIKDNEN